MKRTILSLFLLLALVISAGCSGRSAAADPPSGSIPYQQLKEEELPAAVREWVDSVTAGETKPQNLSKSIGGKTYLLVYAGERSTGGYSITFESVTKQNAKVTATAQISAPEGMAIQAITYPFAVVVIDQHDGEVSFKVSEKK